MKIVTITIGMICWMIGYEAMAQIQNIVADEEVLMDHYYFVGAVEEKDKDKVVGEVGRRWPFSMGLVSYDPKNTN